MPKYMGREFEKLKFDGLDGRTKVEFKEKESPYPEPFKVTVDSSGCLVSGQLFICTEVDLQEFARLVSEAWVEHKKLAPKILTSISGH